MQQANLVQTARHSLKHFFGAWEFALALVMAIPEVSTSVSAEQEVVVAHPLVKCGGLKICGSSLK